MRVTLKIAAVVRTNELSRSFDRRIRLMLGRFETRIERAHLLLERATEDGPVRRCRCCLRVSLRSAPGFSIEVMDRDAETAVRRAMDRAVRLVRNRAEERPLEL